MGPRPTSTTRIGIPPPARRSDYRMHAVMSRISAAVCVVMLLALIAIEARQAGVQRFDRPQVGARSPRNANYDIDVTLDHAARTLTGRETIRWRNISANPTSELQFHLYWNAWRNADSTWLRERRLAGNVTPVRDDAWGSTDVTRLRVRRPSGADGTSAVRSGEQANGSNGESSSAWIDLTSQQRFLAPDDGNGADRTVMGVMLPFEVRPDQTVEVEVEWKAKVPRPFARTGYVDDYYF